MLEVRVETMRLPTATYTVMQPHDNAATACIIIREYQFKAMHLDMVFLLVRRQRNR